MSKRKTYHLYGRTTYDQPLEFITAVSVREDEQPDVPSEADWLEVVAFAQTAVVQVIPWSREKVP